MNEIELAGMADRLQKMSADQGVHRYITTRKDIDQREADLVNREMERRGVDMRVVRAESFTVAFKAASEPGALLGYDGGDDVTTERTE